MSLSLVVVAHVLAADVAADLTGWYARYAAAIAENNARDLEEAEVEAKSILTDVANALSRQQTCLALPRACLKLVIGRRLDDADLHRLAVAVEHSTIPEALATIAGEL
ncbi:hypothetical protein HDA40_002140 [Hamadaea flava]|uniref:ANTAR domain-containing protein n=1 Tax=Hamadaea flava TaxID=1742688 RepID=A0ABV8LJQ1_9ACTN|nr:hypothetical protein [Hamadaea flava]MCP2323633.1 hypothetical protein [Hamadaea flava]